MWRMKQSQYAPTNFTDRKIPDLEVEINSNRIPCADTLKYLRMTLDSKLNWNYLIEKKEQELMIKFRKMYWLMGRNFQLSLHNKLLTRVFINRFFFYLDLLWG
uniref:RNA-directed DNA polymerase from mobile element jockey n=1 Tax=Lygus hesperus TaxID=30085 RepID=A0A0A9Y2M9_LYGHE